MWPCVQPSSQTSLGSSLAHGRPKRVEIWYHPFNGTATIVHGNRSLTNPHATINIETSKMFKKATSSISTNSPSDELVDDENEEEEEEEEAQAEAEEYANMSLIEVVI